MSLCVCCVPMVAHTYIVETALCGYFKNSPPPPPPPPEYANVPMPGKMQSSTVVAQLLGLFLFNSVPLRTRMCLCVLSPHLFVRLLVAMFCVGLDCCNVSCPGGCGLASFEATLHPFLTSGGHPLATSSKS